MDLRRGVLAAITHGSRRVVGGAARSSPRENWPWYATVLPFESTCGKRRHTRSQRARFEGVCGVDGEKSQIFGVPENGGVEHAVLEIRLRVARQPEPRHADIGPAGLLDGLRRAGNCR